MTGSSPEGLSDSKQVSNLSSGTEPTMWATKPIRAVFYEAPYEPCNSDSEADVLRCVEHGEAVMKTKCISGIRVVVLGIAVVMATSAAPICAGAQTWTYLGLGGHVVLSLQAHGSSLYAGTNHGFFTKARESTDTTWTYLSLANYEIDDFVIINDVTFVATRYNSSNGTSVLVRSTDGGVTWSTVLDPGAYWFNDIEMRPDLPDTIYACDQFEHIFKSNDAGLNWTLLPAAPTIAYNKLCVSPENPLHLYAGGEDYYFTSRLYKSMNGGVSWTWVSALGSPGGDNAVNGIAMDPFDENRVHLAMEDYTALSTDSGGSWSFQNFPGAQLWYSYDVVVDPLQSSRVFYLAEDVWGSSTPLHMAVSENHGVSWTLLHHDPGYGSGEARDLEVSLENGSMVAYFAGRGVYRIGPFAVSGVPENMPEAPASLSPAYENNGRLIIPYHVSLVSTPVDLGIFDVQGRPVRRFPITVQGVGSYEVEWWGTNDHGQLVTPGIYFVRLMTSGKQATEKISWRGR
jgi:hypothetical protein